jgi:D-3-phosphoglycerate dehydrogenase
MAATNRKKVVVINPLHPEGMRVLHARQDIEVILLEERLTAEPPREKLIAAVRDADALAVRMTRLDGELIAAAPRLKIISRHGVGVDNIDVAAATGAGIIVAVVGEANAPSVVEHTLMMLLALAKRLPEYDRAVRTGNYPIKMSLGAVDVAGRSVLIVGLGRIGGRLAKVLDGLGMRCLGIDPAFSDAEIRAKGCEPVRRLADGLPHADFVTIHCPKQPDTINLIGAPELALMKPSAYLINCARGGIVDEAALIAALEAGRLKGAGLDVQATEPPRPDDPLLKSDRVILTPHSAATTAEGMVRMSVAVAQNILDLFDGTLPASHVFNADVLGHRRR